MSEVKWHEKAEHLFFDEGRSIKEVADLVGYNFHTVQKVITRAKARLGRTGGPTTNARSYEGRKALSPSHVSIGARLNRYRTTRADHMTATKLGEMIGASRNRVREMEQGFHDFTLRELTKISDITGIPLKELVLS